MEHEGCDSFIPTAAYLKQFHEENPQYPKALVLKAIKFCNGNQDKAKLLMDMLMGRY